MGLVEVPVPSIKHYSQKDIGYDVEKIDWEIIILGMVLPLECLRDHY